MTGLLRRGGLQFLDRSAVSTDQSLQNLTQDFVGMLSGGEEPA